MVGWWAGVGFDSIRDVAELTNGAGTPLERLRPWSQSSTNIQPCEGLSVGACSFVEKAVADGFYSYQPIGEQEITQLEYASKPFQNFS